MRAGELPAAKEPTAYGIVLVMFHASGMIKELNNLFDAPQAPYRADLRPPLY